MCVSVGCVHKWLNLLASQWHYYNIFYVMWHPVDRGKLSGEVLLYRLLQRVSNHNLPSFSWGWYSSWAKLIWKQERKNVEWKWIQTLTLLSWKNAGNEKAVSYSGELMIWMHCYCSSRGDFCCCVPLQTAVNLCKSLIVAQRCAGWDRATQQVITYSLLCGRHKQNNRSKDTGETA